MYYTLFSIAGIAIVGWLLMIILPTWRVTRRLADGAVFPVFLAVLYLIGIVAVIAEMGPGFMRDFGSAEGVLDLLATGPVALVAWIHILAFDHLVGVLIYRDNMRQRVVPVPMQSVILVATLMFGPVGFLTYWGVRIVRRRGSEVSWEAEEPEARPAADRPMPRFDSVVTGRLSLSTVIGLWRRERVIAAVGIAGAALALVTAGVAAVNGGWLLGAEGRLLEAVKFDVAIGIYLLTLALILPFAGFSAPGRRRFVGWILGLAVFAYGMENVQAWRGLDPRFSAVAGPLDQILAGVFFLSALGLLVLFVLLLRPFFRPDALPDHPPLRLALRYAAGAVMMAFGIGIVMSVVTFGRTLGSGDMMPTHAAGFHALQAVPLVALLLGAATLSEERLRFWTHLAGGGWLLFCLGLALQALSGQAPLAPTPALAASLLGVAGWLAAAVYALRVRARPAGAVATG